LLKNKYNVPGITKGIYFNLEYPIDDVFAVRNELHSKHYKMLRYVSEHVVPYSLYARRSYSRTYHLRVLLLRSAALCSFVFFEHDKDMVKKVN